MARADKPDHTKTASTDGFDLETFVQLRRARRLALAFVVGYLPIGFTLFFLNATESAGTIALGLWLVVALASLVHLRAHDCPRCGQLFYADSLWGATDLHIPFGRRCKHCGFTLGPLSSDHR